MFLPSFWQLNLIKFLLFLLLLLRDIAFVAVVVGCCCFCCCLIVGLFVWSVFFHQYNWILKSSTIDNKQTDKQNDDRTNPFSAKKNKTNELTRLLKQVTRGYNIVADGRAGGHNPPSALFDTIITDEPMDGDGPKDRRTKSPIDRDRNKKKNRKPEKLIQFINYSVAAMTFIYSASKAIKMPSRRGVKPGHGTT